MQLTQSNTHIVEKINKHENQIIEGKLVVMDDDGEPLPIQKEANSKPAMVNEGKKVGNPFSKMGNVVLSDSDSDDKVKDAYNETSHLMASGGLYNASLHEYEDCDLYA